MKPKAKDITKNTVLHHLCKMWNFGANTKLTLFSGGTESAGWIIEETDNGNKWIAKIFGLEVNSNEVKDEINLYHFLVDHEIHAPILKADLSNQEFNFIDFKGYRLPVILMRFENLRMCTPSTITQSEMSKIASEIAKMHKILSEYPNKEALMHSQLLTKHSEKAEHKTAYEALIQSVHVEKFSKNQLERFCKIDTKMENYINSNPPLLPQTETIIHADLSLEHAQFLPDNSVYFFDFADRAWGSVSQELATFTTMLYQWEDISFEKWEKLQQWLLVGYKTTTPLTTNDLQAIPQKSLVRLLYVNKYLATLTKTTPSEHVVNWIRRGYELGEYICSKNQVGNRVVK